MSMIGDYRIWLIDNYVKWKAKGENTYMKLKDTYITHDSDGEQISCLLCFILVQAIPD